MPKNRLFLLFLFIELTSEEDEHTLTKRKRFRELLTLEGRRRRDRRIPRISLQKPEMSPWCYLFGSGNDQSLITATGLDHQAFRDLHSLFEPLYNQYVITREGSIEVRKKKGGRKRLLDSIACLGLALMWTRTRGSEWVLSCQFGITGNPISLWIRYTMRLLVSILRVTPEARVQLPSDEKITEYQDAIIAKYSLLQDVYCVADGLKLYLEQSGEFVIQAKFYNGWKCDHYVNNIFVFAPDGSISHMCCYQCPWLHA